MGGDDLTPAERETLKRRTEAFPQLVADIRPLICELAGAIGMPNASAACEDLEGMLLQIDTALGGADLSAASPEQKSWLAARLMSFVGELLTSRYGGHWFLNTYKGTPSFLRYVVGRFASLSGKTDIVIEPAAVAMNYIDQPPIRSLRYALEDLRLTGGGIQ